MKHVFVDTNIIIDLLIDRSPFSSHAADLFEAGYEGKVQIYLSANSFNNVYYLIRKVIGHQAALQRLAQLSAVSTTLDVTRSVVENALSSGISDFEDAMQYYTALSNSKIEAIITRDAKGFKKSRIPILTPVEVLKMLGLE